MQEVHQPGRMCVRKNVEISDTFTMTSVMMETYKMEMDVMHNACLNLGSSVQQDHLPNLVDAMRSVVILGIWDGTLVMMEM